MTNGSTDEVEDDLPGVFPHVSDEVAALGEGLATHDTLVGLLA